MAEDAKRIEDMPEDAKAAARNIGDTLKRQIPEMSGPMSLEESRQQMRGQGPQTVQGGPERQTLPNLDERFAQEAKQPDAPGASDWRDEAGKPCRRFRFLMRRSGRSRGMARPWWSGWRCI